MALKIRSTTNPDLIGEIQPGWSIEENTTPHAVGDSSSGVGGVSFAIDRRDDSEFLLNKNVTVYYENDNQVGELGNNVSGYFDSVNASTIDASVTSTNVLAPLVAQQNMPPVMDGVIARVFNKTSADRMPAGGGVVGDIIYGIGTGQLYTFNKKTFTRLGKVFLQDRPDGQTFLPVDSAINPFNNLIYAVNADGPNAPINPIAGIYGLDGSYVGNIELPAVGSSYRSFRGIGFDSSGNVYLGVRDKPSLSSADMVTRVVKCSPTGTLISSWVIFDSSVFVSGPTTGSKIYDFYNPIITTDGVSEVMAVGYYLTMGGATLPEITDPRNRKAFLRGYTTTGTLSRSRNLPEWTSTTNDQSPVTTSRQDIISHLFYTAGSLYASYLTYANASQNSNDTTSYFGKFTKSDNTATILVPSPDANNVTKASYIVDRALGSVYISGDDTLSQASAKYSHLYKMLLGDIALSSIFRYYVDKVNPDLGVTFTGSDPAAFYPGWSDSLWAKLNELCAATSKEIIFSDTNLVIRDIASSSVTLENFSPNPVTSIGDGSIARYINIVSQNASQIISRPVFDYMFDQSRSISAGVGEYNVTNIQTNVWLTSVQNPVMIAGQVGQYPGDGQYTVSSQDGLLVPPSTWQRYGGSVQVFIGQDGQSVDVAVTGPNQAIPGYQAPYSVSSQVGNGKSTGISVIGSGVATSPSTLKIATGADWSKISQDIAQTINTPFITSPAIAYDRAPWACTIANGLNQEISLTIPMHQLGGLGLVAGSTFVYRKCRWRIIGSTVNNLSVTVKAVRYGTVGEHDALYSGQTVGAHDARLAALTLGDSAIKPLY